VLTYSNIHKSSPFTLPCTLRLTLTLPHPCINSSFCLPVGTCTPHTLTHNFLYPRYHQPCLSWQCPWPAKPNSFPAATRTSCISQSFVNISTQPNHTFKYTRRVPFMFLEPLMVQNWRANHFTLLHPFTPHLKILNSTLKPIQIGSPYCIPHQLTTHKVPHPKKEKGQLVYYNVGQLSALGNWVQ